MTTTVEKSRTTHSGTAKGSHANSDWTTSAVTVEVFPPVGVEDTCSNTTEPGDMRHSVAAHEKRIPLANGLLPACEPNDMGTDSYTARFEVADVGVDTLVVGFTAYGLAGLTAVDYLTDRLSMARRGHLVDSGPPAITPFENGVPRHHTRLHVDEATGLGVVVSERLVPQASVTAVADALDSLYERVSASSLTVLSGVPVAHGPEDHVPFYIATADYRERYLDDTDIRPMGTGYLDGVSAELVARGISDDDRPVGVFTTPAHPQAPDAAAAIRLLDALTTAHGFDVDRGPLESFAATLEAQYSALAERLEAADEAAIPDDRMYM